MTKCLDKKIKFGVNLDIGKFQDLMSEIEKVDKKLNFCSHEDNLIRIGSLGITMPQL